MTASSVPIVLFFFCLLCSQTAAKPNRLEMRDVVQHTESKTHDESFDQKAFLDEEEAMKFENLSPEESRAKLGEIFDKVDSTRDGHLVPDELSSWVERVQKLNTEREARHEFSDYGAKNGRLLYDDFLKEAYPEEDTIVPEDMGKHTRKIANDKLKWDAADLDRDGALSYDEYVPFSYPLEYPHMHDAHVEVTMRDFDTDDNGAISLDEFRQSRWTPTYKDEETPEWVNEEVDTMSKVFDRNSDGQLDKEEVKLWLLPPNHNPYRAEAIHLIDHADDDKDGKLSKDEVLNHQSIFVSSHATAFGKAFNFHEEL